MDSLMGSNIKYVSKSYKISNFALISIAKDEEKKIKY